MGKWIAAAGLLVLSKMAFGSLQLGPDAIYGRDDRKEWYEVQDPELLSWARATAVLIAKSELRPNGSGWFAVQAETYGKYKNLCADQPFRNQPVPGDCSGFLVGPDLLVTAGHCFNSRAECQKYAAVFDYAILQPGAIPYRIRASQVFYCKDVVARANKGDYDFAVIRLHRAVTDRAPLRIRRSGVAPVGLRLTLIGHPMGMPSKISDGGTVLKTSPLQADVDAFSGNSGSAVINRYSGEVEGILINGGTDYQRVGNCNKEVHCHRNCEGETLFPIATIRRYIPEI